jgi:hypothetical protein
MGVIVGEEETKKSTNRYSIILLLVGIFSLLLSGTFLGRQVVLDLFGTPTTGIVTSTRGSQTKSPVIDFTTEDGEQVTFRSWHATNFIVYSAGEEVDIIYLPAYPRVAEVRLLGWLTYLEDVGWFFLSLLLTMGGLVAVRNKPITIDLRRKSN